MTVIAYDGKILAADRQGTTGNYRGMSTKMHLLSDGSLFVGAGPVDLITEMRHWIENGEVPCEMPNRQRTEDFSVIFRIHPGGPLLIYEQSPLSRDLDGEIQAAGNGREYALGVMHAGLGALKAVEVAARVCQGCGHGVDYAILSKNPKIPHGPIQRLVFEQPRLVEAGGKHARIEAAVHRARKVTAA